MIKHFCFSAAVILAACTNPGAEPTGIATSLSLLAGGDAISPRFTAIANSLRPVLQVGLLEAGTAGNMLLEGQNGTFEHYLSPNGGSITLNNGMLHSMFGFADGLMAADTSEPLSAILRNQAGTTDRIHTYLQGDDRAVSRTYRCVMSNRGTQSLTLSNATVAPRLMSEDCRNAEDALENLYWVDQAKGQIVQSRQWAGPRLGAISMRRAGVPQ